MPQGDNRRLTQKLTTCNRSVPVVGATATDRFKGRKSVRNRIFVLPLPAVVALGVIKVAVEGQVIRPTGLADASACDKGRGWLWVAR